MLDLDIAAKLMPNIATIVVQLLATGVIYLMYKKYLHEPVHRYLTARKEHIHAELSEAEALRKSSEAMKVTTKEEYDEAMHRIKNVEEEMLRQAEKRRKAIIDSAQDEIDRRQLQLEQDLASERERLYEEVQTYLLEVAVDVNRKVLEDVDIDNAYMIEALEKEMDAHDYKH